jgi:hypothetical protein
MERPSNHLLLKPKRVSDQAPYKLIQPKLKQLIPHPRAALVLDRRQRIFDDYYLISQPSPLPPTLRESVPYSTHRLI